MKILFLQKVDNASGGVINVNLGLMQFFLSKGHDVEVIAIRHGYTWEDIRYPKNVPVKVVNTDEIWGMTRLSEVIAEVKQGHIFKATKMFFQRQAYKRAISEDYLKCQEMICEMHPDIILNSHYEVLAGVPESYLHKTIMHFHTSYDQVKLNRSYIRIFEKYKDKIACFVWLSKKTCERAIQDGFEKSKYIYNAISFSTEEIASSENKKVIFVGRLAEEKRVWLAIQHFTQVTEKEALHDWIFEIYGDGDEKEEIQNLIADRKNIFYMGQSDCVQKAFLSSSIMVLTSSFEGMPLVVLEANECGVPVVAYDFGESSSEVIHHNETGILVEQNDYEKFSEQLEKIMSEKNYRQRLAKNAKEFAKSFTMEKIGQQWLDLFHDILN